MIVPVSNKRNRTIVQECSNCGEIAADKHLDVPLKIGVFTYGTIKVCPHGCIDEAAPTNGEFAPAPIVVPRDVITMVINGKGSPLLDND